MPARHKVKSRLAARKVKKTKPGISKLFFVIPIIGIVLVFIIFSLFVTTIGNLDRVSIATPDVDGNIVYNLFDFKSGTIITVNIPSSTQLTVARGLGTWKIGSVWKLGQDQKIGGALLSETVTKSLKMPTFYWGDPVYANLGSDKPGDVIKSIFTFKQTNLGLADRIKIGLFSLQVKLGNRSQIDLSKSKYLTRSKIQDGSLGYKVSGNNLPFDLQAAIADDIISKEHSTILLENQTGRGDVNTQVSEIIDIIGGKISSISKLDLNKNIDCVVYGDKNLVTVISIAKTFACKIEPKLPNYNFDIVIRVGEGFSKRY